MGKMSEHCYYAKYPKEDIARICNELTSLLAYRQIQISLGERQKEVFRLLKRATECGFDMTNMEIAKALGWSINCVTPRVYELRQKGLIVLSCIRNCGVTGKRAMAWKFFNQQTGK